MIIFVAGVFPDCNCAILLNGLFQLARLRDSEIARMRMEEKEASRKELEQMKKAVCPLCTVSF